MENNESVVAEVIRQLEDFVIVPKYEYANMLCAYKKCMNDRRVQTLENEIAALKNEIALLKKNRKWWQKIF